MKGWSGLTREFRSRYHELSAHLDWLPGWVAGLIDWYAFRSLRGGIPFNGQFHRLQLVKEIFKCFEFRAIVETGTDRGLTTAFLHRVSGHPVYSVEASERSFYFAKQRFRHEDGVFAEFGDSRAFLKRLGKDPRLLDGCVFFYLDAHLPLGLPHYEQEELPLYEELEIIARSWPDPVIMIDDFQVPDDPAYGFNDYGNGGRLTVGYLPTELKQEFRLFWPAVRGEEETGPRRGCVVAGRRGLAAQKLETLSLLRVMS